MHALGQFDVGQGAIALELIKNPQIGGIEVHQADICYFVSILCLEIDKLRVRISSIFWLSAGIFKSHAQSNTLPCTRSYQDFERYAQGVSLKKRCRQRADASLLSLFCSPPNTASPTMDVPL